MTSIDAVLEAVDGPAADALRRWRATRAQAVLVTVPDAVNWPFTYPLVADLPVSPAIVWMPDFHEACVNHQTASTRLVTTQAAYLMQAWIDATDGRDDVLFVATANPASLAQHAPEVLGRRGPFARDQIVVSIRHGVAPVAPDPAPAAPDPAPVARDLPSAFRTPDPAERLAVCVAALDTGRTAARLLAAASACMEVNDLDAAARDLADAVALAPRWAAAHFERGKLWLRLDDMERASGAFRDAAERMPGFGAAWANLGAALGELDRPEEALAAFHHALATDPDSPQALNNIGVVSRELGRLAESEAAFGRVMTLAPDLAFGYYNLGHTLFLQGRYQAALSAYAEGQRRDGERNPVQGTRLALCRLATGDSRGALGDLQRVTGHLPRDYRRQLLADTQAIAWALLTHRPDLAGWADVHDWLAREIARS